MAIKVSADSPKGRTVTGFPKLVQPRNTELVILMTSFSEGTVIFPAGCHKVGDHSETWYFPSGVEDFEGTVSLVNKKE